MHISARTGIINNDQMAATAFALDVAEMVESSTGNTISVWSGVYGMPLGSLTWSTQVETFADVAVMETKLMENADYVAKVTEAGAAGLFIPGSFENHLARVIHAAGVQGPIEYVSTISATALPGKMHEAIAFATSISDHAAEVTGNPNTVGVSNWGTPGLITWFGGYAGADSVDAASEAIAADAEYQERVAAAADLFVPNSSQTTLARRLR